MSGSFEQKIIVGSKSQFDHYGLPANSFIFSGSINADEDPGETQIV
jgi:hypothetical protein